jgi:hypothetical protein
VRRLLLIIFLTLFGLGVGLAVGALLMRRVDRAARAMRPSSVADRAVHAIGGVRQRVTGAVDAAGRAAAQRQAELRAEFDVPTVRETLRGGGPA